MESLKKIGKNLGGGEGGKKGRGMWFLRRGKEVYRRIGGDDESRKGEEKI